MKCNVWKPCSNLRWQDELLFLIWRFFELSELVTNHLLCYWPTIDNLISKICPKFQVFSFHLFEVDELLNQHWARIVRSENISTPIYVECNKMYQSKVCIQDFWFFVSGLHIQPEQSENDNASRRKKSGSRLLETTIHVLPIRLSPGRGVGRPQCRSTRCRQWRCATSGPSFLLSLTGPRGRAAHSVTARGSDCAGVLPLARLPMRLSPGSGVGCPQCQPHSNDYAMNYIDFPNSYITCHITGYI